MWLLLGHRSTQERHSKELDALQKQTLFVCGPQFDLKYEKLMRVTFGDIAAESLGISFDLGITQDSEGRTAARIPLSTCNMG